MLGYAHNRQPTVILRRKSACLDMCTAVNHDPTLDKNLQYLQRLYFLCGFLVLELIKIRNIRNFGADLLFWN